MPRKFGEHHDAGVGDVDRRVLHRRQVEAQVHLAIDLLVAEEVGPLIGEPRLHLRVAELGERFTPQHLGFRLRRQTADGVPVLLAELAVDGEESLQQSFGRTGVHLQVGCLGGNRRNHAIEEALVDGNPRAHEGLRKRPVLDRCRGLVAGGIARIGGERGVDVLIVTQREKRHAHRRIAEADRRGRVGRILGVADPHAGVHVSRATPATRRTPRRRG